MSEWLNTSHCLIASWLQDPSLSPPCWSAEVALACRSPCLSVQLLTPLTDPGKDVHHLYNQVFRLLSHEILTSFSRALDSFLLPLALKNKKMLSSVVPYVFYTLATFSSPWAPQKLLPVFFYRKLSLRFLLALKFCDAIIFHHPFALILSLSATVTYFVECSRVRVIAYLYNLSIIFITEVILKIQCKMYKYLIRRL